MAVQSCARSVAAAAGRMKRRSRSAFGALNSRCGLWLQGHCLRRACGRAWEAAQGDACVRPAVECGQPVGRAHYTRTMASSTMHLGSA